MPLRLGFLNAAEANGSVAAFDGDNTYALLQSEPPRDESTENINDTRRPSGSFDASRVLAVLLCVGCVAINWFISITYPGGHHLQPSDIRLVSGEQSKMLRRPSPFVGFDSITRITPPTPRALINYPTIIALVNASDPHQVFSDDPKLHMTATGTVSPEERQVIISNSISTIVQFRAMDYQMERCELHIKIPNAVTSDVLPASKTLAVYRIAADQPLDSKELSYSTRPSRIARVGEIIVGPASAIEWRYDFRCVWDSISTFEVAYLGQGIDEEFESGGLFQIEWWQGKTDVRPAQAVYLIQRESA